MKHSSAIRPHLHPTRRRPGRPRNDRRSLDSDARDRARNALLDPSTPILDHLPDDDDASIRTGLLDEDFDLHDPTHTLGRLMMLAACMHREESNRSDRS